MGIDVAFMPNVGQWFQGITHTINIPIAKKLTSREIRNLYQERYAGEPLVKIVGAPPSVKDISGTHGVEVGGFAVHSGGNRVVSFFPFLLLVVMMAVLWGGMGTPSKGSYCPNLAFPICPSCQHMFLGSSLLRRLIADYVDVQVINVTIDNLLKGAATQALQNMNLALGYAEFEGIPLKEKASGGIASF